MAPSFHEKAPQDSIQSDALLCAYVEPGYYVRNTRCEVIGDTGDGGYIGIAYRRNIECVGQRFALVPGLGGYVAYDGIRFGACTGP
ncbi:MAG: hypothetical protein IOD12_07300 [Silvanigrellales bacterium]|nr:hypothetical protein [Silvanigrellales bacterium]